VPKKIKAILWLIFGVAAGSIAGLLIGMAIAHFSAPKDVESAVAPVIWGILIGGITGLVIILFVAVFRWAGEHPSA
jgi:hypothetical protein